MTAPPTNVVIDLALSRSAVAFLDLVAQRRGTSRETVIEAAIAGFIEDWQPHLAEWQVTGKWHSWRPAHNQLAPPGTARESTLGLNSLSATKESRTENPAFIPPAAT